jgi:hypothetical protein
MRTLETILRENKTWARYEKHNTRMWNDKQNRWLVSSS